MSDDEQAPDAGADDNARSATPVIVGIGASAGGLEAFKRFFRNLPTDSGMAFVLFQHLNPEHDSMLVDLLQRETDMPVAEAEDGAAVQADHVYVIPPNATLTIADERLVLVSPAPPRRDRRPIDTFFVSLAERIGHDFSQYKAKTLTRRIQRRMQVLQIETMDDYIDHLRAEPRECELLFHELLISVTEFFREPEAGMAELEQELRATRAQLNATIDDLEATNAEMKSANAELTSKNEQINRANSDLQNLLESTDIATLFLDNELRVKTFTPTMRELFHLRDGDRGRPVTDIATRLDYADLKGDVEAVQRKPGMIEREVHSECDDATYIMRIRPYRTVDNVIDGVVITFTDISASKRDEAQAAHLAALVDSTQDAIVSKNLDGIIQTWNRGAQELFGYSAEEAIGQSVSMLIPADHQDEEPRILRHIRHGVPVEPYETVRQRKDGSLVDIALTVSPIKTASGKVIGGSKIARDISARVQADRHRDMLMHELDHRARNMLNNAQSIATQTLANSPEPLAFKQAFLSRLTALGRTHDLLTHGHWRGAALTDLVARELAPYHLGEQPQWRARGEHIKLNANATLALGMAVHELATNAVKFGALSTDRGRIDVRWHTRPAADGQQLQLCWAESGGPAVTTPSRRGFGSRLVEEGLAHELNATVSLEFKPAGVRCTIKVALGAVCHQPDKITAERVPKAKPKYKSGCSSAKDTP